MWWPWGGSSDKPTGSPNPPHDAAKASANATTDPKKAAEDFDPNHLPDRKKLPKKLQKIIDKSERDENFLGELVEG